MNSNVYGLAGITLLLTASCTSKTEIKKVSHKQPNIVFIMADDHAYQAISAYGGPLASLAPTPNIDRLAEEGMRFNRCMVTNSLCGPSRACILTGKYSHMNGFVDNTIGSKLDCTSSKQSELFG